ncbi:MAG: DPP IV N-terminal domain-containing protein, partial [Gluconacetobacter diazotrophicus]|nr:DPP IV N-terminal domain-containing protein [Gluconacetobacter diazotrophicus]
MTAGIASRRAMTLALALCCGTAPGIARAANPARVADPARAADAPAESCFARAAATRNGSLGAPTRAMPTPDGGAVIFLRSGPRDTALHLYRYEIAGKALTELAKPDTAGEHLSVEEKARRERARMTLTGITDFALSRNGRVLLLSEGGRLGTMDPTPGADGTARWLAGSDWIGPRLSPDGRFVAAVRNHDLHVVELATGKDTAVTAGGSDTLTHGVAEFAAAEELERPDGTWWSPDGETLLFE